MKTYQIQFSPTGTTARVAAAIASGVGFETILVDVTHGNATRMSLGEDDLAIIAAPVYGGRLAPVARERFSAVSGNGAPCVLVAVYGNRAFESALCDLAELAERQGFVPVAAAAFVGEHSYSTASTPIAVGRPDADDISEAADFGRRIAARIAGGGLGAVNIADIMDIASPEASLVAFRNFVAEYSRRRQESPQPLVPQVDAQKCVACGVCASVCPVDAVTEGGLSTDASRCIKCCACVKNCRQGARTLASPFAPVLSSCFGERKPPVMSL